jgi:hypothetical protein
MPSQRAQRQIYLPCFFICSKFVLMWLSVVTAKLELQVSVDENGLGKIESVLSETSALVAVSELCRCCSKGSRFDVSDTTVSWQEIIFMSEFICNTPRLIPRSLIESHVTATFGRFRNPTELYFNLPILPSFRGALQSHS